MLHTRSGRATKSRTFYDDADASAAEVAAYIAEHPGTLPSEAAAALAAIKDPPRPKRSAAAAAAAGLAKAPEHSVWVQCDECAKWRLVRTEAAPGEGQRWVCSMNADARHNSCAAAQHLHERAAPEDGERVEPMGYKSREQLADDLRPCTAAQREYLLDRLPRSMGEHGWVARPVAGSFTTHRLYYAYAGKGCVTASPFFWQRGSALLWWEQRLHAQKVKEGGGRAAAAAARARAAARRRRRCRRR